MNDDLADRLDTVSEKLGVGKRGSGSLFAISDGEGGYVDEDGDPVLVDDPAEEDVLFIIPEGVTAGWGQS